MALASRNSDGNFKLGPPKSLGQGCSTTLVAALDPEIDGGAYLKDCNVAEPKPWARETEDVLNLWELSENLVGEKFEF